MIDEASNLEDIGAEAEEGDCAVKKRRVVWMLLGYAATLGVVGRFLPEENSPVDIFIGLPALILGIWWCYLDAEERGDRIGAVLKWTLILFFYVGFPVYVIRSRGVRGFVTLAYALLLVGGMAICMLAMVVITLVLSEQFGF